MIKLILLRHGNTFEKGEMSRYVGRRTDLSLTKEGVIQAERAADRLKEDGIVPDVIFHGPLARHKETAAALATRLGITNTVEVSDLNEIDYGLWENLSEDEIQSAWKNEFISYKELGRWPETVFTTKEEEFENGLRGWLSDLNSEFNGRTVLVVTSNGVLRALNKIFRGTSYDHNSAKVKTGGLSFVKILNSREYEIESWNT